MSLKITSWFTECLQWGEGTIIGDMLKKNGKRISSKNILMPHGEGELKYPDGKVVEG